MGSKDSGAGLRGQSAGQTAVCTVGAEGNSLRYRGFDVVDLASQSTFYETAHMIMKGHLPTADELAAWTTRLKGQRGLPLALRNLVFPNPESLGDLDLLRAAGPGHRTTGWVVVDSERHTQGSVRHRFAEIISELSLVID